MNKMLNCLVNKVMCTAVVALGAFAASARSVLTTNALYDAVNTDVSVGYQVSGLEGDEIAVVFTNDACEVINWKVPARLNDVQFLVVGGGGGGGGAASYSEEQNGNRGGAGGGGGGVVTGSVAFAKNSNVYITVGAGGPGGKYEDSSTSGAGKATTGESSQFSVGVSSYVIARGGGADEGYKKKGGSGGSTSGARNESITASLTSEITDINTTYITSYKQLGHIGGVAHSTTPRAGGGGGGAEEDGYPSIGAVGDIYCTGGQGGKGLESSITGLPAVYGSGGGGGGAYGINKTKYGRGGNGGSIEAGKGGGTISPMDGTDGFANFGGGGGGAGKTGNGGNGGSGIVVFRYKDPIKPGFKVIVR